MRFEESRMGLFCPEKSALSPLDRVWDFCYNTFNN